MSQLIREGSVVVDDWLMLGDDAPLPQAGKLIVSWQRWEAGDGDLRTSDLTVGVLLPNTLDIAAIWPKLADRPLLALNFPAFGDGRAYSQAAVIRRRYGFKGELRAVGQAVVRDQLQQMKSCGFDSFLLRADQDAEACARSFHDFSVAYQPIINGDIVRLRPGRH
jgi:uncharacterized protein (DUF934 family)